MSDWVKSDYCTECGGEGFYTHSTPLFDDVQIEEEQCPECERLHELEVRADIAQDVAKGN